MKSRARGIIVYLILAFGLAWIPLVLQWSLGLHSLSEDATFFDYVIFSLLTLPTSFAPAIGAFVVRRWITREGFADAGLRLNIRKEWRYYGFALLYPFLVVPVTVILASIVSAAHPDFSTLSVMSLLQMIVIAIVSTPVVWGEEFGWRGYLQARLFAGKPLLAAIAVGLIWGVWHYPMILLGYLFSGNPLGLLLYPLNMMVTSILYGWFRLRSGSIWPVSLAHAAGNTMINPLLASILPNLGWPLVWAGYRLITLAALCAWILLKGQLRPTEQHDYNTQFST